MTTERNMEDGKISNEIDRVSPSIYYSTYYGDNSFSQTSNGHDSSIETSSPKNLPYDQYKSGTKRSQEEKHYKRINPLRIHLGKRPFVDNSVQFTSKKKKSIVNNDSSRLYIPTVRTPKIPKVDKHSRFHNALQQPEFDSNDEEEDKPIPRLVPKSKVAQFKNKKPVKEMLHMRESVQKMGAKIKSKYRCRRCCSMTFSSILSLKEHQLQCPVEMNKQMSRPEPAPSLDSDPNGPTRVTKKVFLCSACGTYYENWNLFLHMKDIHNRHICLFCLSMFSKAQKLTFHLINKHKIQELNFASKDEFLSLHKNTIYLMCCECEEICSEKDFFNHDCSHVIPRPVPLLVSKSYPKSNSNLLQSNKLLDSSSNGIKNISKEVINPFSCSNKFNEKIDDPKRLIPSNLHMNKTNDFRSQRSESANIGYETDSNDTNSQKSDGQEKPYQPLANGNDNHSNDSQSEAIITSVEKEKAIKLTLSLNKAKSPVIINSTVDPHIGQNNLNKPPSRYRRPPKRYDKNVPGSRLNDTIHQQKAPSIKMTICDNAESLFVKSTVYENLQEPNNIVDFGVNDKQLLNNNIELAHTSEPKLENTVKSTIYDNTLEYGNTLNRVPKLTVKLPKELLDKNSSSDYTSDSDVSDKLTVDENFKVTDDKKDNKEETKEKNEDILESVSNVDKTNILEENKDLVMKTAEDTNSEIPDAEIKPLTESDIILRKPIEISLDRPIDKYPLKDLLKVFLNSTVYHCIYCNHARKIAVDCEQLCLHMVTEHRFSATVNSITAEELLPETIITKVKNGAIELKDIFINLEHYDSETKSKAVTFDNIFECFQCFYKTVLHKDLYLHNRKMHQKTILLCVMCKSNFYSYSELLCHLCPGTYVTEYETRYRCCLCSIDSIPSSFRLMVHLRKMHHTCDVCLEFCQTQLRLSNHVWKHKLHHLCYRCGIAYRNKLDINNHLFWKHGTESASCNKCLQKKWPHVYHFCTPPNVFVCDECSLQFSKAVCLRVHKRLHSNEYPHCCSEEGCLEKFISKKLLEKHLGDHRLKSIVENLDDDKCDSVKDDTKPPIKDNKHTIDPVNDDMKKDNSTPEIKAEVESESNVKKAKKKKLKDKDALMIDVNLPALNLSESDSSDESDSGRTNVNLENEDKHTEESSEKVKDDLEKQETLPLLEEKSETYANAQKSESEDVLDIWDNFKKYQANIEKPKEKTPPLKPIKKHVCESDHDYCIIPSDLNLEDDTGKSNKKKNKKNKKAKDGNVLSSSSSSSDSDSSCSCGSNCSCSSSSSSSSSTSNSDSSGELGMKKKKNKKLKKSKRRISNSSNVDVMGVSETPVLIPEKLEPPIPETDLETEEGETDEEFYDVHPQRLTNKLFAEKRNQLMMLASVAPSDVGSISGDVSRSTTPAKDEKETLQKTEKIQKIPRNKKKSKKRKKSKKHDNSKTNIPIKNEVKSEENMNNEVSKNVPQTPAIVQTATPTMSSFNMSNSSITSSEKTRASKRRRVPNKFYGYSSDEESGQQVPALKPQLPPKLEWRKEDLPSPVTHKKREIPSVNLTPKFYYTEPIRLTAPIPDPEPPRILMNTDSPDTSESDSSDEGALQICPPKNMHSSNPFPPPSYLNSGTSSLPYPFQRPPVREAREGESVYCYCRCPYDEVSEMIACDAEGCPIEWFHFECVGIMVPPKGKWYCPECRRNHNFPGYR